MTMNGLIGLSEAGRRTYEAGLAHQRRKEEEALKAKRAAEEAMAARIQQVLNRFKPTNDRQWPVDSTSLPRFRRIAGIYADAMEIFGKTKDEINSHRRSRDFIVARFYVAQRLVDDIGMSLPQTGRILGDRDHTTILHAISPKNREWVRLAADAIKKAHETAAQEGR